MLNLVKRKFKSWLPDKMYMVTHNYKTKELNPFFLHQELQAFNDYFFVLIY